MGKSKIEQRVGRVMHQQATHHSNDEAAWKQHRRSSVGKTRLMLGKSANGDFARMLEADDKRRFHDRD